MLNKIMSKNFTQDRRVIEYGRLCSNTQHHMADANCNYWFNMCVGKNALCNRSVKGEGKSLIRVIQ